MPANLSVWRTPTRSRGHGISISLGRYSGGDAGFLIYQGHIASPDVHVDHARKQIVMFYHGGYTFARPHRPKRKAVTGSKTSAAAYASSVRARHLAAITGSKKLGAAYVSFLADHQITRVALSDDGLAFRRAAQEIWARPTGGGSNGTGDIMPSPCPVCFTNPTRPSPITGSCQSTCSRRACAMRPCSCEATNSSSSIPMRETLPSRSWPARFRCMQIAGNGASSIRKPSCFPRRNMKGLICRSSHRTAGGSSGEARQLRDPCVFVEDDRLYLLYSAAGEHSIAGARLAG